MKDAKGIKAKDSKETNRAFSKKIAIEIWPKKMKIELDKDTEFAGEFEMFAAQKT